MGRRDARSHRLGAELTTFFFLAGFSVAAAYGQSDTNTVRFRWAFVAYPGPAARPPSSPIVVDRDTTLSSGDEFKLLVNPLSRCYAYVFWIDSKGVLEVLFPSTAGQFDTEWVLGQNYEIPEGKKRFKLDEAKGQEVLHVLVSRARLRPLDRLIDSLRTVEDSGRRSLQRKILNEIRDVKRRSGAQGIFAERPATIAGTVRDPDDIERFAVEFEGESFYSKAYLIKHR